MGYNGWKNYETWNVALWIGNDEGLYLIALECDGYQHFANIMGEYGSYRTKDDVAWNNADLDIPRLDEMIAELRGEV